MRLPSGPPSLRALVSKLLSLWYLQRIRMRLYLLSLVCGCSKAVEWYRQACVCVCVCVDVQRVRKLGRLGVAGSMRRARQTALAAIYYICVLILLYMWVVCRTRKAALAAIW